MRREEWADIRRRHRQGVAIKQIARDKGISRNTVRRALAADEPPTRRARGPVGSAIDPYEPRIVELLLSEPEVSAADIARRIGWGRSLTVLKDRVRTLRRDLPRAGREDTPKRGRPLPAELTSFVGRSTELACIAGLLETARVVSLTGPGGVGKTRLAIRAASTARHHFADGTCMAQLGSLRDPALLVETLLDDFGITDPAGSASEPINRLVDHLQGRQVLLLLDNCEHLVQDVARLVTTLLESAAGLNVLATSRERLGIPGEHVVIVAPLELAPAVALFADRAAAALPGFAVTDENRRLVTQLCRSLDGIPLAIELATVRLRALSLEDLLSHLDHRFAVLTQGSPAAPARHRTLEATIDWSFELCTGHERALWTRASVFAGGFDVAAATAVCADATLPAGAVLDGVAGLVAKSILVREEEAGQVRFRMLETIRELGQERLPAAEQRGLSIRHRDWCLDLVERCAAEWFGPDQIKWTRRLRREQANLRAALEHALTQGGGISVALRLVGGPWFLWATAFSLTEHRRWLHRALDASTGHEPERATALATCGLVASLQGDQPAAGALAAESLDLAGELSQPTAIAYATHVLGLVDFFSGDAGRAEARLGECLSSYQALGVGDDLVGALHVHLGLLFISRGELERAEAHLDEMRPRCEARGERWIRSYVLDGLGFVALARGDLGGAASAARESLELAREFDDTIGLSLALDLTAWTAAADGQAERAAVLLGGAAALWRSFGQQLYGSAFWQSQREHYQAGARGSLGPVAFETAHRHGANLSRPDLVRLALGGGGGATVPPASTTPLSRRELEVARLVALGRTNREIAAQLVLSHRTVEGHVSRALDKLHFTRRTQLATWVSASPGQTGIRVHP